MWRMKKDVSLASAPTPRLDRPSGRPAAALRRVVHYLVVGVTVLAGLPALTACQHPAAQRRLAARERSVQLTVETMARRERAADQRLQRTAEFIREDLKHDGTQLDRDLRALGAYLEDDLRRWQKRQSERNHKLGEIFGGKPENIERTLIMFL